MLWQGPVLLIWNHLNLQFLLNFCNLVALAKTLRQNCVATMLYFVFLFVLFLFVLVHLNWSRKHCTRSNSLFDYLALKLLFAGKLKCQFLIYDGKTIGYNWFIPMRLGKKSRFLLVSVKNETKCVRKRWKTS